MSIVLRDRSGKPLHYSGRAGENFSLLREEFEISLDALEGKNLSQMVRFNDQLEPRDPGIGASYSDKVKFNKDDEESSL